MLKFLGIDFLFDFLRHIHIEMACDFFCLKTCMTVIIIKIAHFKTYHFLIICLIDFTDILEKNSLKSIFRVLFVSKPEFNFQVSEKYCLSFFNLPISKTTFKFILDIIRHICTNRCFSGTCISGVNLDYI